MISEVKRILNENSYTCVAVKGEFCFTSKARGVKPLLELIDNGADVAGGVAADKVVGRAAAFLYVLLGVKAIYADVISESAYGVLKGKGIFVEYGLMVPAIRSRDGKGFCPMEQATLGVEDGESALQLIRDTLKRLAQNSK